MPIMWRFALRARHAVPLHFPDGGLGATAPFCQGVAIPAWNAGILPASNAGEMPALHVHRQLKLLIPFAETAMPIMWRFALRARHAVPLHFPVGGRAATAVPTMPHRGSGRLGEPSLPYFRTRTSLLKTTARARLPLS
jgi:hypothetical protein